ncbi:DUF4352 domain-containing protein [Microbacterium sp. B35-30]|uniref:DUF4352 domain-containing protein n=1 Tax=Microbacterium sp. B35-30 TaxID=1962642 RepID=UPI0013D2E3FF|nr:DUF4352 domain-containing protein [Microbacterium sp. B35-30]KAF2416148.1 hypothetical protein B2K11_17060 [Microbacterium sp. B35-30]
MARADRALPRWAAWSIGAGLVVAAWFVALVTPGEEQIQGPMPLVAAVGEEAVARNIAATVTDVRRTSELHAGDWSAEGNWVVVELDVASVASEDLVSLNHAELVVDGVRYGASDRPDSLRKEQLSAGIPTSGGLAFELPADLASGDATLELAVSSDRRLDSMIMLDFDLAAVPTAPRDELPETGWANL